MSWRNRLRWPAPQSVNEHRWVVLDVETSGLDTSRDELLCVAALAMERVDRHWALVCHDSFEQVLRPVEIRVDHDNVLLHGLGHQAQINGIDPCQALDALRSWVDRSPVLAFHADFDRAFLQGAYRRAGLPVPGWPWLDLADVLPVVFAHGQQESLDDWLSAQGVICARRHEAAADVWATAQLWLKACAIKEQRETMRWLDWQTTARQGRWLRRMGRM